MDRDGSGRRTGQAGLGAFLLLVDASLVSGCDSSAPQGAGNLPPEANSFTSNPVGTRTASIRPTAVHAENEELQTWRTRRGAVH
jgi:hypothetical protein